MAEDDPQDFGCIKSPQHLSLIQEWEADEGGIYEKEYRDKLEYSLDLQCLQTYFPPEEDSKPSDGYRDYNLHITGFIGLKHANDAQKVKDVASSMSLSPKYKVQLRRLDIDRPYKIQAHLWHYLSRGQQSALIVAAPATGKSHAYLVPIIGTIKLYKEAESKVAAASRPTFLIVSSSAFRAERLARMACQLLGKDDGDSVLLVSCPSQIKTKRVEQAFKSCIDLLIATPGVLIQMSDDGFPAFENLNYLIFDDADVCFTLHKDLIMTIYKRHLEYWTTSLRVAASLQKDTVSTSQVFEAAKTILVAEKYTPEIRNFYKCTPSFDVIQVFGDLFELAFKNEVPIQLKYSAGFSDKIEYLRQIMNRPNSKTTKSLYKPRLIVCCVSDQETELVAKTLPSEIVVETFTSKNNFSDAATIVAHWEAMRKSSQRLLIISDEFLQVCLQFCQIRDCELLFHFSLPAKRNTFSSRFNLMSDSMTHSDRASFILYSEENSQQARAILGLYQRLEQKPPDELRRMLDKRPVYCNNFAALGKCVLQSKICVNDHVLNETEPNDPILPTSGQIKFEIFELKSANQMIIKLLGHRDVNRADASWTSFEEEMKRRDAKINSAFRRIVAQKIPSYKGPVRVGEKYMAILEHGSRRVRIDKVINQTKYRAYELDTGRTPIVDRHNLRQFSAFDIPSLALSCYITGIEPIFGSVDWSVYGIELVKYWMSRESVKYATAWVHLATGNQLWIYDVSLFTEIQDDTGSHFVGNIERLLIREKFAVTCPKINHSLANDPFMRDTTIVSWTIERLKSKHQWAFLGECDYVYLLQFKGFNKFFVRISTFNSQLTNLEKLLAESPFVPLRRVLPGLVCVCRTVDDGEILFNRVIVLESFGEGDASDANGRCRVFHLDHGDTRVVQVNQLSMINVKHIELLPYQAIECCMDPVDNLDAFQVANEVVRLTRDEENYYLESICQRISAEPVEGQNRKCFKVQLFLFEKESDDGVNLIYHSLALKLGTQIDVDSHILTLVKQPDDEDVEEDLREAERIEEFNQLIKLLQTVPSQPINRISSIARKDDGPDDEEIYDSNIDREIECLNELDVFYQEYDEQHELDWAHQDLIKEGYDC